MLARFEKSQTSVRSCCVESRTTPSNRDPQESVLRRDQPGYECLGIKSTDHAGIVHLAMTPALPQLADMRGQRPRGLVTHQVQLKARTSAL